MNLEQPVALTPFGDLTTGATSAFLGIVATQPLSTWKTVAQANSTFSLIHDVADASQIVKPRVVNSASTFSTRKFMTVNPVAFIRQTLALKNRVTHLWAGLIPNATSGALAESIAFLTYGVGKKQFEDEHGKLSKSHNFLLSSIAGLLGSPANSALEQLMIRQQLYKGSLASNFHLILNKNGWVNGIFKGSCVTGGRDMGFNIGVFALYDTIKETTISFLKNSSTTHENTKICEFINSHPILNEIFAGLLSGSIAGFLTNPLDRCKTMMQQDLTNEYPTFRATVMKVRKEGGLKALWLGAAARTVNIGSLICAIAVFKDEISKSSYFPSYLKIQNSG